MSDAPTIPKTLLPAKTKDVQVFVETAPLEGDFKALADFAESMGLAHLSITAFKNMHQAGVAMERLGVTRLAQPSILVATHRMTNAMGEIEEGLKNAKSTEEKSKLAHSLGYLGGQISKCVQTGAEAADESRQEENHRKKNRNRSFAPGATVPVQINITNSGTPVKVENGAPS